MSPNPNKDGILWEEKNDLNGTFVLMKIRKDASTQVKDIFDEYAAPEKDPSFHKTLIPVKLMEHEGDALISRSQAKRLISRFDRFTGYRFKPGHPLKQGFSGSPGS